MLRINYVFVEKSSPFDISVKISVYVFRKLRTGNLYAWTVYTWREQTYTDTHNYSENLKSSRYLGYPGQS